MNKKYIVTIAPPTPNGDLHVGHLSGPYLAADVYARARRKAGDEATLISYSDDYQSYMVRRARERGQDPLELARSNGNQIASTLALAGIALDHFMLASASEHFRMSVAHFASAAQAHGALVRVTRPAPFCESCSVYGYEAFGRGSCAVCGTSTDASQCEHCAHAPDITGVHELRCILCSQPMSHRPVERLCLDLARYRPFLRELHSRASERPQLRTYIDNVLARPSLLWPIDRPGEHGVDVPEFGRIHTWFSGIAGYHAAFAQYCEKRNRAPLAEQTLTNPDSEIVHFLGFDCAFSHAIVYPTLLHLAGYTTRVRWFTNAFLKLDGQDFSTSRGHAVWVRELLQEASVDAARLYVALVAPEEQAANFERTDFRRWRDQEFAWLEAVARGQAQVAGQTSTPLPGELTRVIASLRAAWQRAASAEHFSMRGMAEAVEEVRKLAVHEARIGSQYGARLLGEYADMAQPLAPALSHRLQVVLSQRELLGAGAGNAVYDAGGAE